MSSSRTLPVVAVGPGRFTAGGVGGGGDAGAGAGVTGSGGTALVVKNLVSSKKKK